MEKPKNQTDEDENKRRSEMKWENRSVDSSLLSHIEHTQKSIKQNTKKKLTKLKKFKLIETFFFSKKKMNKI